MNNMYIFDPTSKKVRPARSGMDYANQFILHDRTLKQNIVNGFKVWTLFLGLHGPYDLPTPFKTIIEEARADAPRRKLHGWTARYATAEEAERGHDAAIDLASRAK